MGLFDTIKYRLAAALSPEQMTRQVSKSNLADNWQNQMFGVSYKSEGELDYEDYDKMLMDPQIKSGFELIRMFLLSRKLKITPASEEDSDIEIADQLEKMIDNMKYPMRKVRNDIYTAIIYGYSVSEIIWGMDDDDEHMMIKRIRPIPIETIQSPFKYNDEGDVEEIVQTVDDEDPIKIDPAKCLIYTYDEKFGNREGTSILDGVYENWFMKQKILNWWNVFLQKHEGPTLAGFIENPAFKDAFREQLDEIQEGRTNITAGLNDRIEVLESTHRGEGFKDAIDYHDNMIFRKMNIGTMILGQEDGAGAYAQSKTQNDVLDVFLDGIHADIAAELQIKINELIDMNWSDVEDYPVVEFETFEEVDTLGLLAQLKPLIDAGAIDPYSTWFRQLLADVISKFSDVDVDELVEEQKPMPISDNNRPGEITPEQQELVGQVEKAFPAKKPNVTPAQIEKATEQ
jgi:hypothetical protein